MLCRIQSIQRYVPWLIHLQTYQRLSNLYATLGDTTKLPIEVIVTTVYTLNERTIVTCNALHIPALRGVLYSFRKHCQRPGCGVYYSYKYVSYLFFPDSILHVEDSYDKIFIYRPLVTSHQGPIDYREPISTRSTTIATPSGHPSTITTDHTPQYPHIIPSDEESL